MFIANIKLSYHSEQCFEFVSDLIAKISELQCGQCQLAMLCTLAGFFLHYVPCKANSAIYVLKRVWVYSFTHLLIHSLIFKRIVNDHPCSINCSARAHLACHVAATNSYDNIQYRQVNKSWWYSVFSLMSWNVNR